MFPKVALVSQYVLQIYNSIFNIPHLPECRVLPGDLSWPDHHEWNAFNNSISGRLIKTIPLGHPCHHPNYNEEECKAIRLKWRRPDLHLESSSSIMDSIYLKKSCDPFTHPDDECLIGAYVQYAVNISEPWHVAATLDFIREHNIRLVIKNTGHDYMGKSTGTGGVSVWMHHLQDITFLPEFNSKGYSGPAFKVGAGVLGERIAEEASKYNLNVVSGECLTVGIAGGYIQGGGHSALSSTYGLGADQALSYEVVIPNGDLVIASPEENQDLYWALSGGGGGTYGIVWSVTIKAHPNLPVTVGLLSFASDGLSQDAYWDIISSYLASSPQYANAKAFAFSTFSAAGFSLTPLFAVNSTKDQASALLSPMIQKLDSYGVQYLSSVNTFSTYSEAFSSVPAFQYEYQDISNFQLGSRLLPKSLWESNDTLTGLVSALRGIADAGGAILDVATHPTLEVAGHPDNSVLPAWRNAFHSMSAVLPLDNQQSFASVMQDQEKIAHTFLEPLRKLTPGGGAYLNEASPVEPDFKETFYGINYERLLKIKDKYDPDQLLYGSTSVGGDRWKENSAGRLCRTNIRFNTEEL